MLTHFIMTVLGAGLAVVLLLAFYSPASGGSGSSSPGSGMVPAPASPAAPLGKNAQDIAARVRPGVVIINTALRYNSEQAAGTGMVINSSGLALGNAGGQNTVTVAAGQVTALNQTITASEDAGSTSSETLHGMIQANADIVAGDSGGPLAGPGGVIGMDTAGNDAGSEQQAVGFAIPVNTALSVASQITAGRASSAVAIGYPPFLGIFVGTGSDSSPQDQAQQGQQQYGSGGSQGCSASNAGLAAPSVIAPVSSGVLVDGTICGSPAAQAGLTGGAVITTINGQAIGSPDQLGVVLARFRPGDTISVAWVSPAGQRTTSSIRLTAGPPQ